jgi:hypothetical protein
MGRILQLMDLLVNKGIGFLDISKFILPHVYHSHVSAGRHFNRPGPSFRR